MTIYNSVVLHINTEWVTVTRAAMKMSKGCKQLSVLNVCTVEGVENES